MPTKETLPSDAETIRCAGPDSKSADKLLRHYKGLKHPGNHPDKWSKEKVNGVWWLICR